MHTLSILDRTGDTKLTWDPDNPGECASARETVAALKAQGYTFFLVDGKPADEVTAGGGTLVVRKLTADEVVAAEPEPPAQADPAKCRCGKPAGHRGRCPGVPRNVVAVRPVAGG